MSRFVLLVAFALLCVTSALAAPADEEKKTDVATTSDKKTPADDRQAVVSESSYLDTLFSGGNAWNALATALASLLILSGLGLAYYYFYHMNNYPGQQEYSGYAPGVGGVPGVFPTTQAYGYYPTGRAMPGGSFSFPRVLDLIAMAQETYEKFDFQSLDCQKKALCDLTQKQSEFGETGRKISSTFSFMDVLDGLPMPKIIQAYLKEYKEAIIQGKNSSKDCASVYPKCDFSIKEVFVKYSKKGSKDKEQQS